jgi:hypothetical protein
MVVRSCALSPVKVTTADISPEIAHAIPTPIVLLAPPSRPSRKVFVERGAVFVKKENTKQITLEYHFDNVNQSFDASIDQLINQMEMVDVYKDGGTKMYQGNNYRMLVCNTIDGNKDVYFGDLTLEYENDYCVYK